MTRRDFSLSAAAALSAVALAALLAGCEQANSQPHGNMPPPAVSVVTVEPQPVAAVFEYVGQTAGSREVEVRARVSGILLTRNYREGAIVRRGQSMYSIDPAPLRAALDRADAEVASAQARVAQAEHTLARLKPLHEARAVSQKEYDDAAAVDLVARADLKGALARRAEAALNLGYASVEAPIGGVAGRSLASEGTLVAGPQVLLTTITQNDPI